MKSYNHLWERFLTPDNYREAVKNATRRQGKNKRKKLRTLYIKEHAEELMPFFLTEAADFHSSQHTPKVIYDGVRRKQRQILVPTEREQVIHHMVINVLQPIFLHGMYEHSYGSIPGRGAHAAKSGLRAGFAEIKRA